MSSNLGCYTFRMQSAFKTAYEKLNKEQKLAVDTTEGPVMVVAGPGTGKTEVLALRIINIVSENRAKANEVLCLTFTNAGVRAMRERLSRYIGGQSVQVRVSTFHSFASDIVEKNFSVLGFFAAPKLMDETDSISISDEILETNVWEHIRPRGNGAMYFRELKSLVSIMKRERLSPNDFRSAIDAEIKSLQEDPASISSRGETKGQIKKEIQSKIDGLERSREVVSFYEKYEEAKRERGFMDYDDVLEYAVKIAEESEDVRADLQINFQYVLIDEHQDSSGVQNQFLRAVWGDVEQPNVFVVGDDRQLIYGFGGASLDYFEDFRTMFGHTKLITLVENYRSTQVILDTADKLLSSVMADGKLKSNVAGDAPVVISECDFARDEILLAGIRIKKFIDDGIDPNHIAILVPKNKHVKSAAITLRGMGIAVAEGGSTSLFSAADSVAFRRVLGIISAPFSPVLIAESVLDEISQIPPIVAHRFLRDANTRNLSIDDLVGKEQPTLLPETDPVRAWGEKLSSFISLGNSDVTRIIQTVADELLFKTATDHATLIRRIEIVRSFIHLATSQLERNPNVSLIEFLEYIDRLQEYGSDIPLAIIAGDSGVRIMTLHASKGLEYEAVFIAHMDEKSLGGKNRSGFTLPESILEKIEDRDEEVLKRQIYVAITRAKRFCTISYARKGYTGGDQSLSPIFADMDAVRETTTQAESIILAHDPKIYGISISETAVATKSDIAKLVAGEYEKQRISVTHLNNFFECPWKWYFRNFIQMPEPESESLIFGSIVHSVIEEILKSRIIPDEKAIKEIISRVADNQCKNYRHLVITMTRQAIPVISSWVKNILPEFSKSYETERNVFFRDLKFPNLSMTGKIDLTERFPDGSVIVSDFKTGSSKTKPSIEKITDEGRMSNYMRQLAMYSYLLNGAEKGTHVAESKLIFLEAKSGDKNAIYRTHITDHEIESLIKDISDFDQALKSGSWTDRPCNEKSYGGNTECEYCKRMEMIFGK
ncbi:MAG: UvrD/REP helicase, helicase / ATP-dependent helicase PcrA [Patescibacteria group bacterium]|nr:UvrD/REP helicase, helicase / ATP-dependent helicase PcrA [Patescibacteria group bacterium]